MNFKRKAEDAEAFNTKLMIFHLSPFIFFACPHYNFEGIINMHKFFAQSYFFVSLEAPRSSVDWVPPKRKLSGRAA